MEEVPAGRTLCEGSAAACSIVGLEEESRSLGEEMDREQEGECRLALVCTLESV